MALMVKVIFIIYTISYGLWEIKNYTDIIKNKLITFFKIKFIIKLAKQNHNKHYLLKYRLCVSILILEYHIYIKMSNELCTSQHEPSAIF